MATSTTAAPAATAASHTAAAPKTGGRGILGLIYKGLAVLNICEEDKRQMYRRVTGKDSLKAMSTAERWRVLEEIKLMGFRPSMPGDVSQASGVQEALARHLWLCLRNYGELRDGSERALLAYIKRITKVARMEWLKQPQMTCVIETLKKWVARVEMRLISEALAAGRLPKKPSGAGLGLGEYLLLLSIWQLRCTAYLESFHPEPVARPGRSGQSAAEVLAGMERELASRQAGQHRMPG